MASLADLDSGKFVKLTVAGPSGCGKTGGLASLVKAGFDVRVLDLEYGIQALKPFLTKDEAARVSVAQTADEYTLEGDLKKAVAFREIPKILGEWQKTLKPETIIVVDTLTTLGRAFFNHYTMENQARRVPLDGRAIYGLAGDHALNLIRELMSKKFPCHVILLAHVDTIETPDGLALAPRLIGNKAGLKLGPDQNFMVGMSASRKFYLEPKSGLGVKIPHPEKVKDLGVENGLNAIFQHLLTVAAA